MLILNRSVGTETVVTVGEVKVRILVLSVQHNKVRLGFDGPPEAEIRRKEVCEKKQDQSDG